MQRTRINACRVVFAAMFFCGFCDATAASDVKTHILGSKGLTLSPDNDTVNEGIYAGSNLSSVDPDLAADNIKKDIVVFGVTGTLDTAPPEPTVGGSWLLVPGDSALGTHDFWVQKYEAKNVSSVPTSEPSGFPWVSITQTEAKNRCEALGPGYHLITMHEAQTINRNIENNAWNWTNGAVGDGALWRGHSDNSPGNSLAADVTGDPDDDPYVGTGNTTPSIEKRIHQVSTGQYIWDWSGNVGEWVDMTCMIGSGAGYWYRLLSWIEWNSTDLSDYEKGRAGPAGAYTSSQAAGKYFGCVVDGNAVARGGDWYRVASVGVFTFDASWAPSSSYLRIGLRCVR